MIDTFNFIHQLSIILLFFIKRSNICFYSNRNIVEFMFEIYKEDKMLNKIEYKGMECEINRKCSKMFYDIINTIKN